MITCLGKTPNWKFRLDWNVKSVSVPPLVTESPPTTAPEVLSDAFQPRLEMPLGSVALTVMEARTSTRVNTVKLTLGGVLSVATDWMVTVTPGVSTRRPAESSPKPVIFFFKQKTAYEMPK